MQFPSLLPLNLHYAFEGPQNPCCSRNYSTPIFLCIHISFKSSFRFPKTDHYFLNSQSPIKWKKFVSLSIYFRTRKLMWTRMETEMNKNGSLVHLTLFKHWKQLWFGFVIILCLKHSLTTPFLIYLIHSYLFFKIWLENYFFYNAFSDSKY